MGRMQVYQVYNKDMIKKPNSKLPLHKFIALGGKPKDYKGAKNNTK